MSPYRTQPIEPEADPFPSCKLCGQPEHEVRAHDGTLVATWGPCQRPRRASVYYVGTPKPLPPPTKVLE